MENEKPVKVPNTPSGKGDITVVNILGNEIRLRTESDSAYIHRLAGDIEGRIKRCMSDFDVMSSLKAVILVCLDLADELEKAKKNYHAKDKDWEEKIEKILARISAV